MLGRKGKRVAAVAAFAVAGSTLLALPAAHAAATPIVIWVDANRLPVMQKVVPATYQGHPVQLVENTDIKTNIATISKDTAPDIFIGVNDWTGGLVANGDIVKLYPTKANKSRLTAGSISAFALGNGQWGMPYAVENVGVVVNRKLVKTLPKTWAAMEKLALAVKTNLKKAGAKDAIALAVPQPDPYHMYPLFSALGGYIFGPNGHGGLDPYSIKVANPTFLKNAPLIDKWNKEGLISSTVTGDIAQKAFVAGHAPFWITGPWQASKDAHGVSTLNSLKFPHSIIALPQIIKGINPKPFIGVQGFFVSKFADQHGVGLAARSFVNAFLTTDSAQKKLALYGGRAPADPFVASAVTDADIRAFGVAGKFGVSIPTVPQMNSVWGPLGDAWVKSTSGAKAIHAVTAFKQAQSIIIKTEQ